MEEQIRDFILQADSKVLATLGDDGVNVVPVSTIKVINEQIWLFNFFMDKTIENIKDNKKCSLTCWSGMVGFQIKSTVEYVTEGELFQEARTWALEKHPDRTMKGLLILTPMQVFDISPTQNSKQVLRQSQK